MNRKQRMLVFAFLGIETIARAHAAPSLVCKTATTPVDRLVCADDRLVRLDREIDRVFHIIESEKDLPPEWRSKEFAALAANHKNWLAQRATDCAIRQGDGKDSPAALCLEDLYHLRLDAFRRLTHSAGPALDDLTGALTFEKAVSLVPVGFDEGRVGRYWLKRDVSRGKLKLTLVDRLTSAATPIAIDVDAYNADQEVWPLLMDASGALLRIGSSVIQVDANGHLIRRIATAGPATAASIDGNHLLLKEFFPGPLPAQPRDYDHTQLQSFTLGAWISAYSNGVWPIPGSRNNTWLWRGRLVVLTPQSHIAIYSNRLDKLSDTPVPIAPGYQSDGYEKQPQVLGDLLLIPDGDKGTLIFDLAHARALPFIASGFGPLRFQQFGNLLFVLEYRSLAIFDLATSRGVTRFHLVASDFEVDGNRMTLYAGERGMARAITFRMNLPRIRSHETLVETLLAADARARDALARRGSVFAALDAMDLLEADALSDPKFDPRLQPVALDYATWLAQTLDGNARGISILERLHAADAGNATFRRRLGAALLRAYLIDGDANQLKRARYLLDPAEFPTADLAKWQTFRVDDVAKPLGRGFGGGDISFSGNALVVDHPRIGGLGQRITYNYDRDTLRELPIGGDHLPAPGVFEASTKQGHLNCKETHEDQASSSWECTLRDARTSAIRRRFTIEAAPIATNWHQVFDTSIAPDAIAHILLDADLYPGRILAASNHWVALTYALGNKHWLRPLIDDSLLAYRNSDSAKAPLRAASLEAPVLLDPPLIDDRLGKLVERSGFRASQLDLATNVATTLVDLHEVNEYNPSALGGDLAFFLDGGDVVAYDLKSHSLAAVLKGSVTDVIVPQTRSFTEMGDFGPADQANWDRKLLVDRDHLFVIVSDPRRSRVISLAAFAPHAAVGVRLFKAVDGMLGQ